MPNLSSLAGLKVVEKFLWGGGGWGGVVCTVIFMSNPTVVLCCVGVLTIYPSFRKWINQERTFLEVVIASMKSEMIISSCKKTGETRIK